MLTCIPVTGRQFQCVTLLSQLHLWNNPIKPSLSDSSSHCSHDLNRLLLTGSFQKEAHFGAITRPHCSSRALSQRRSAIHSSCGPDSHPSSNHSHRHRHRNHRDYTDRHSRSRQPRIGRLLAVGRASGAGGRTGGGTGGGTGGWRRVRLTAGGRYG